MTKIIDEAMLQFVCNLAKSLINLTASFGIVFFKDNERKCRKTVLIRKKYL